MSNFNDEFNRGMLSPYLDCTSTTRLLGYRQVQLNRSPTTGDGSAIGVMIIGAGCLWAVAALFASLAWLVAAIPGWVWWATAACLALGLAWYLYPLIREEIQLMRVRRLRRQKDDRECLKEQSFQLCRIAFRLDMMGNRAAADDAYRESQQIEARLARGAKP